MDIEKSNNKVAKPVEDHPNTEDPGCKDHQPAWNILVARSHKSNGNTENADSKAEYYQHTIVPDHTGQHKEEQTYICVYKGKNLHSALADTLSSPYQGEREQSQGSKHHNIYGPTDDI
ncbi:hypothetical protein KSB_37260 [Ktedonobacter robiniae]|uniref:Uncharacterized protein n=1 Tax=Ktedonobacter robiniae TaxID=2778365 RepID=A0ABQ3UR87_9CHLR|nr:hypothetical protein KSB_37260 [Ktedonobacter robiniae]